MQCQSFSDVHSLIRDLTVQLAADKVTIRQLEHLNKELEKRACELEADKKRLQVAQVAFSASLGSDGNITLGPFDKNTPLIYGNVVTNIGNAYNPNTGVFTAPVRGAYHFEYYIGEPGQKLATAVVLMKNQQRLFTAAEHQTNGFGTAANGVTLLLDVGDQVCVNLYDQHIIFDNQNRHTTFSGHLLFTV